MDLKMVRVVTEGAFQFERGLGVALIVDQAAGLGDLLGAPLRQGGDGFRFLGSFDRQLDFRER